LGSSVSESVDALIVVTHRVDLTSSSRQLPDHFEVASVEILVFIDKYMAKVILQVEIWVQIESTSELIDQFRAQCIAEYGSMLSPRSNEGRIRKEIFPLKPISLQGFPIRGELIKEVLDLADSALL
jgi:hypothetical protein